jgi:hypothetical protein
MMTILGSFTLILADQERKLIPKDLTKEFKIDSITMFLAAGLFFVSLLPVFWNPGPTVFIGGSTFGSFPLSFHLFEEEQWVQLVSSKSLEKNQTGNNPMAPKKCFSVPARNRTAILSIFAREVLVYFHSLHRLNNGLFSPQKHELHSAL